MQSCSGACRKMHMVEDKHSRTNMKSKRKKTLIKKVIEFSQLFNLDVMLIIHDKEALKLYEYNSGCLDHERFTFKSAQKIRKMAVDTGYHKLITDHYYDKVSKLSNQT